jgi:chromosome partitioning protein
MVAVTTVRMITSLVSQKGGVGKSTLAVSIAWELMARGARVLLVDTDPQGTTRRAGEMAAARGLTGPTTIVIGKGIEQSHQLPRLVPHFDHVIIDTPGHLSELTRPLLLLSDVMLIPVGQSGADVWGNEDIITIAHTARETLNPNLRAALVFVRSYPQTILCKKARAKLSQQPLPLLSAETTDRVAWQEAIMAGQGVTSWAPKDRAAAETRALVSALLAFGAAEMKEVVNG